MKINDWFFDKFGDFDYTTADLEQHKPDGPYGKRKGPRKRNHYIEATVIGVVLTALSYVVGLAAGWINHIDYLEVFAVFTSYLSTWLSVVERRWNYVWGAISSLAYAILFVHADLVASAILNFYLVPALLYGWFRWGKDATTRAVEHVSWRWVPVYVIVTAAAYLGALGVVRLAGGTLAWTDSAILIGTILAQFLLDNKKVETWFVWAAVNVFAIYTYFNADLNLVGFQYIFFLINTSIGYFTWRRSMTQPSVQAVSA